MRLSLTSVSTRGTQFFQNMPLIFGSFHLSFALHYGGVMMNAPFLTGATCTGPCKVSCLIDFLLMLLMPSGAGIIYATLSPMYNLCLSVETQLDFFPTGHWTISCGRTPSVQVASFQCTWHSATAQAKADPMHHHRAETEMASTSGAKGVFALSSTCSTTRSVCV